MRPEATSNPIGPFRLRQVDNGSQHKLAPDVVEKQKANQTEGDFTRDFDKDTPRQTKA